MKKLISLILVAIMVLSLFAGCGKSDGYKVAIVQQLDHSSLDEIRQAVISRLEALAQEKGISIAIETFNGQNDATTLTQIGAQVAADGYDMVIPIATLAAQYMVTAHEGMDTPIVYAAISDPEGAGLTGLSNVTGVSDALNTPYILDMMLLLQPDVKTVGLLYSKSEINSQKPIADAKAYLESKGIEVLEKTGHSADEVIAAANALVGRVDAVFTPTDNAIMACEAAVAETFLDNGIPHYTGADSFVLSGGFVTCGVNYSQLGFKTAQMAFDILMGGKIPAYHVMEGGIITVNTATATGLGLDYSPLSTLDALILEVDPKA